MLRDLFGTSRKMTEEKSSAGAIVSTSIAETEFPDRELSASEMSECSICYETVKGIENLNAHMLKHTGITPFECVVCHEPFTNSSDLNKHKEEGHEVPSGSKKGEYTCDVCSKLYVYEENLIKHKRNFHDKEKNIFTISQQKFLSRRYRPPAKAKDPKVPRARKKRKFECLQCSKKFLKEESLDKHVKWMCRQQLFKCDICHKGFAFQESLDTHKAAVHIVDQNGNQILKPSLPYKCGICQRRFPTSVELGAHDRTVHTQNKPYGCDICYQSFSNQEVLGIHIRLHTGEEPFMCEWCGAAFVVKCFLTKHKKENHKTVLESV